MTCFCPMTTQPLRTLLPRVDLSVRAIPPQMTDLIPMAGMATTSGASVFMNRPDVTINAMLPNLSPEAWFRSILPTDALISPVGGGPMFKVAARLANLGASFPLENPRALMQDLQTMANSLKASMSPFIAASRKLPKLQMRNMVMAAKFTMSMRQQGICPIALSGVDVAMSDGQSQGAAKAQLNRAVQQAAKHRGASIPGFALPFPKLSLALSLAGMGPMMAAATAPNAPDAPTFSDPGFGEYIMGMLSNLAQMPALPFDPQALMNDVMQLADLSSINEAFGPTAMTQGGVMKINKMLGFFATLSLPAIPSLTMDLIPKLDLVPDPAVVETVATSVPKFASTFQKSMTSIPAIPMALPGLEAISALRQVLTQAMSALPTTSCAGCRFI